MATRSGARWRPGSAGPRPATPTAPAENAATERAERDGEAHDLRATEVMLTRWPERCLLRRGPDDPPRPNAQGRASRDHPKGMKFGRPAAVAAVHNSGGGGTSGRRVYCETFCSPGCTNPATTERREETGDTHCAVRSLDPEAAPNASRRVAPPGQGVRRTDGSQCTGTVLCSGGDGQHTETVPSSLRTRMSNSRSLRSQRAALRLTSSAS